MSEKADDPYLDPVSGVLRNLVGATNREGLKTAEADLVAARTVQMLDHRVVAPTRDANEICGLHRHLFQDLYDWAGTFRTINMRRGSGEFFAPCAAVPGFVDTLCGRLYENENLGGLDRMSFVSALAQFYNELNFTHPFREGNGRTQRLFWSRLAFDAGWILDWRPVLQGAELNSVSRIAREEFNLGPLEETLSKCVSSRAAGSH